jgi:hypothetical protein
MTHLSLGFLCGEILNYTKKKGGHCFFVEKNLKPLINQDLKTIYKVNSLTQTAIREGYK